MSADCPQRILIVSHYFPPEAGAPQARLSALAAAWAANGDEVTVLTGMPNHPTGVLPPEYRRAVRRRERRDGYHVVRTWLYATPNEGVLRKTLCHLSFMVSSVLLGGWACGRTDTVVVSSPTFFSIGSAWLLARLKRARLVVEGILEDPFFLSSSPPPLTRGISKGAFVECGESKIFSRAESDIVT